MNVVDIHDVIKLSLPAATQQYSGERDTCYFPHGKGRQIWHHENWRQIYSGYFLRNSIHNSGTYKWANLGNEVYVYEGKFHANNLEGYGVLSYPDGGVFEGLFCRSKRFGPGVFTHPDGTKDVGLWSGTRLVRLSQGVDLVPNLARSGHGKAFLLQYKSLVSARDKFEAPAEELLDQLGACDCLMSESQKLYSKYVRNPNSLFFNQKFHYESFSGDGDEDYTIDILEDQENGTTRQVVVSHLLAWNNGQLALSLLKHAFRHRNHEHLLSYRVSNLLTGRLNNYAIGPQESACLDFLRSCFEGDEMFLTKIFCQHDFHPDLTDSRGNSGLLLAVANNKPNVIRILTNFGASVDNVNDESLTPLLMCLLRYISTKYDVLDWELSFLPRRPLKDRQPEVQKWPQGPQDSSEALNYVGQKGDPVGPTKVVGKEPIKTVGQEGQVFGPAGPTAGQELVQVYMFDQECHHPEAKKKGKQKSPKEKKKKEAPKKEKKKSEGKKGKMSPPVEEPQLIVEEKPDPKAEYLKEIFTTLVALLQCGACPNFGEVPFPPLILSLFTRDMDIVHELLRYGADCNIRTSYYDGSLTPLHVIASLPPTPELLFVATVLLNNGANPNYVANTDHWPEEKKILLAGTETEDLGKTPLHLLCIMWDFESDTSDDLGELCSLFINHGSSLTLKYLGHTPLSLAIVRGNTRLMSRILNSGLVDPNESLGNGMGNPLTVLILKRYTDLLSVDVCEKVYDVLLEYYANPFSDISGLEAFEGNAIEFCVEENAAKPQEGGKKGKKANKKGKKKKTGHEQVIQIFRDHAEDLLIRRIQTTVVKILFEYKILCGFNDPVFSELVKFVTLHDTCKFLQILLDHSQIFPSKTLCFNLLEYVKTSNQIKEKKSSKKPAAKGKSKITAPEVTVEDLLDNLDFSQSMEKQKKFASKFLLPELDPNEDKFKVCFECLQRKNKVLILCPKCELVYFCSQECNIINNKKPTRHPCQISFYDSELQALQKRKERGEAFNQESKFDSFKKYKIQLMESDNFKLQFTDGYDKREVIDVEVLEGGKKGKKDKTDGSDRESKKTKSEKGDKTGKGRSRSKDEDGEDSGRKKKGKEKSDKDVKGTKDSRDENEDKTKKKKGGKDSKEKNRDEDEDKAKKKKGGKDSKEKNRDEDEDKAKKKKGDGAKGGKDSKEKNRDEDDTAKKKKGEEGDAKKKDDAKKRKSEDTTRRTKDDEIRKSKGGKDKKTPPDKLTPDKAAKTPKGTKETARQETKGGDRERFTSGSKRANGNQDFKPLIGSREKEFVRELYREVSDICAIFDYSFLQMIMPYCVFADGQFYYKFDDSSTFCRLTYSNI